MWLAGFVESLVEELQRCCEHLSAESLLLAVPTTSRRKVNFSKISVKSFGVLLCLFIVIDVSLISPSVTCRANCLSYVFFFLSD